MLTPLVRRTLQEAAHEATHFGSDADAAGQLSASLWTAHRHRLVMLYIAAAMIVVLFVIILVVVLVNLERPAMVAVMTGAGGLSISGLIVLLLRVSREVTQSALLAALIDRLPASEARAVVLALLEERQLPTVAP